MLIKELINYIAIAIGIFSIPMLIYSIKNKNKYICNWLITINIFCIVNLIIDLIMIEILYIPVGLEIIFTFIYSIIVGVIYAITIILNIIKRKRLNKEIRTSKIKIATTIIALLPIVIFTIAIIKNKIIINNSELVVVYESSGNGGIGDGDTFAYAIGKDYCKQFDLGIDIGGYKLKKYLPKNSVEIKNQNEITDYKITFNEKEKNNITVYKNNKKICEVDNKSYYFNISFEKAFYIKK